MFVLGLRAMTGKNRTDTEREFVLSPTKTPLFCVSVSQLYPLFALHAEDQNFDFQEAVEETTADGCVICPSVSKILHIIIVE